MCIILIFCPILIDSNWYPGVIFYSEQNNLLWLFLVCQQIEVCIYKLCLVGPFSNVPFHVLWLYSLRLLRTYPCITLFKMWLLRSYQYINLIEHFTLVRWSTVSNGLWWMYFNNHNICVWISFFLLLLFAVSCNQSSSSVQPIGISFFLPCFTIFCLLIFLMLRRLLTLVKFLLWGVEVTLSPYKEIL